LFGASPADADQSKTLTAAMLPQDCLGESEIIRCGEEGATARGE
jgi:hypothetical protein